MVKRKHTKKQDPFFEREASRYENPIPSREYILDVIVETGKPCSEKFLQKILNLKDPDSKEGLKRRLNAMIRDCQLIQSKSGFSPLTILKETQGELYIEKDGFGSVYSEEEDQYIKLFPREIKGYYDGDELKVRIIRYDYDGVPVGEVVELIEASVVQIVGRFQQESDNDWVIPLERKYNQEIKVPKGHNLGAKENEVVLVEIDRNKLILPGMPPIGEVIEVLGDPSTEGIEIQMAVRKFGIPDEWPEEVIKAADKFGKTVPASAKKEVVDLTGEHFVTIDGEDARDFDDAVLCMRRNNGGYKLCVAIADVSHYVRPGTPLDIEAEERGNSVYFPGYVIPMLPENLSNELCSLKPGVERLSLVCEMLLDKSGKVTRAKFFRGVIKSHARLTYTDVARVLDGDKHLRNHHQAHLTHLESLHEVYQVLRKGRDARGAIDFDTVETQILFDKAGKIESILPRERNVAHKIIEECMLLANVTTAKFLTRYKVPVLYRVHNGPPEEKLSAVREFLKELGLDLRGRDNPTPKDYTKLLSQIQDREDRHVIETVLLRSLSQAEYSPNNEGHFGLAYEQYCHFTSPIRRYPDLLVHRQIVAILSGQKLDKSDEAKDEIEGLGQHCSMTERRADEATRDAVHALKCHYMKDKVGEQFAGRVTAVTSFGLFVELQDLYIDGLVHVATLGDDYYYYEPFKHRMIGEHTRETFQLGDLLQVQVIRVDVEDKKIDLEIIKKPKKSKFLGQDNNAKLKQAKRDKKRSRKKKK